MVTRYTVGNIHNFKTALKVLLVGILLGTAAAVSTPFANQEGVVRRLNEKQEYVITLVPDHRGNRTYRDHQGTSQVQGPPVDFRSLQVTCGRMNRLQAATSDACLPWMHT